MIKLTRALKWSPDGMRVETVEAGEYDQLPDRAVEIAAQLGILANDTVDESEIKPEAEKEITEAKEVISEEPEKPTSKAKK